MIKSEYPLRDKLHYSDPRRKKPENLIHQRVLRFLNKDFAKRGRAMSELLAAKYLKMHPVLWRDIVHEFRKSELVKQGGTVDKDLLEMFFMAGFMCGWMQKDKKIPDWEHDKFKPYN